MFNLKFQIALQAFAGLFNMIICFDHDAQAERMLRSQFRRQSALAYGYSFPEGKEVCIGFSIAQKQRSQQNKHVFKHIHVKPVTRTIKKVHNALKFVFSA